MLGVHALGEAHCGRVKHLPGETFAVSALVPELGAGAPNARSNSRRDVHFLLHLESITGSRTVLAVAAPSRGIASSNGGEVRPEEEVARMTRDKAAWTLESLTLSAMIFVMAGIVGGTPVPPAQARVDPVGGPCKPCSTWGEIKSCYSDDTAPAPCCGCMK